MSDTRSVDLTLRDDVTWPEWGEQVPRHCGIHRIMASHISASHYSLPNICPHTDCATLCRYWSQEYLLRPHPSLNTGVSTPLRHNILNGLQIFTIPRMMSCDHKKPHFRPRRQYFRPTRGDNTSGRHVAHVAPHYNRSLQSANRNARFFSKQPIRSAHTVPSLFWSWTGLLLITLLSYLIPCLLSPAQSLEKYGILMILSQREETGILFLQRAKEERGSFRIY